MAVLKWVRAGAEALPEPEMPADVQFAMLNEMHYFLKKSRKVMALAGA